MDVDPDYACFKVGDEDAEKPGPSSFLERTARKEVEERIKSIIIEQFDKEIDIRENELMLINERLTEARHTMDRLRACVVASFYAKSFTKSGAKGPGTGASQHPAIQNVLRRAATTILSKNPPPIPQTQKTVDSDEEEVTDLPPEASSGDQEELDAEQGSKEEQKPSVESEKKDTDVAKSNPPTVEKSKPAEVLGGRLRVKKTIIVGNVSKYIPADQRESTDKSTHKWMVYVRGDKENPKIDGFVRKVWFFLHPSYRPHDIVEVSEAPFHLTRRGWGEFPIRVQIHFCDRRSRPIDVIHGLKLDRTYTGLQTLGAETVCEVELDQSSLQISPADMLVTSGFTIEGERPTTFQDTVKEKASTAKGCEGDDDGVKVETAVSENKESSNTSSGDESDASASKMDSDGKEDGAVKRKSDGTAAVESCSQLDVDNVSKSGEENAVEMEENEDNAPVVPIKRRRKRRKECTSESLPSPEESEIRVEVKLEHPAVCSDAPSEGTDALVDQNNESRSETRNAVPSELMQVEHHDPSSSSPPKDDPVKTSPPGTSAAALSKDSKSTEQPVVVLPNNTIFRMRSASDGENFSRRSPSDLLKSAITISPAISVKVNPTSSYSSNVPSTSNIKNLIISSPKSTTSTQPAKAIVLPISPKASDTVPLAKSGKERKEMLSRTMIPLSSLLKTGGVQPSKPLVLKVDNSPLRSSPTFSINILSLANQANPKQREKRSLSADLASPPRLAAVTSWKTNKKSKRSQTPLPQLHIINPSGKLSSTAKKSSTSSLTPITLQTLQTALSSGNVTFTQKMPAKSDIVKNTGNEVIGSDMKGKLLSPINPQPSDKSLITIVKPKGKKLPNFTIKLIPEQKAEVMGSADTSRANVVDKNRPIHEVVGDSILPSATSVIEDILPLVAKKIPLVKEDQDLPNFPFCAKSESEFLDWNVGKQRASELKRAILIQKVLKCVIEKTESLKGSEVPSKKFLMNWCLRHGYSVFTDEFEDDADAEDSKSNETDDKKKKDNKIPTTLTSSKDLIKQLEEAERQEGDSDSDSVLVDVTSLDSPVTETPSEDKNYENWTSEDVASHITPGLSSLLKSPEAAAVEEQTRLIGIHLNRMGGLPSSHLVMAKALQQFAEALLRKSLSSRLTRRDGSSLQRILPNEISIIDVVNCIQNTPVFHFLTDNHLGSEL